MSDQVPFVGEIIVDGRRVPLTHEQLKAEIAKDIRELDEGRWYDEETVFREVEKAIAAIENEQGSKDSSR